ncbi:hypothetical protein PIB30_106541, partial [Stylosanthes scabra]|nr:hypothetical protein [Stylosanthes scabra]
ATASLGHGHLWTRILESLDFDLTRERVIEPSKVPTEAEAPPQLQPDYAELIQRGFDDMRTLMSEGFTSLSDRMDRLDIQMTSQSVEIQDLRGEFRSFRDSFQRFRHQEQQDPAPGQD